MTPSLEDRLADAYLDVVQAVQPVDIPAAAPRPRAGRNRHGRLIPFLAAAAVVLAIAASVTVPRLIGVRASDSRPATQGNGTSATPPFIVTVAHDLQVHSAATGRVLLTMKPGGNGAGWKAAAATADPRLFLVTKVTLPHGSIEMFWLRLSASGSSGVLSPVSIPSFAALVGTVLATKMPIAVSADGRAVAFATPPSRAAALILTGTYAIWFLRDGVMKEWTTPSGTAPASLTLSADGGELGYVDQNRQAGLPGSAWVLPTTSPSGDATGYGHEVFAGPSNGSRMPESEFLTPDGKTMYIVGGTDGTSSGYPSGLYAYDVATGTLLRTVATWNRGETPFDVTAAETGDVALVWDGDETDEVNLTTGAFAVFRQLSPSASIAW